jgi:hypothetical protein
MKITPSSQIVDLEEEKPKEMVEGVGKIVFFDYSSYQRLEPAYFLSIETIHINLKVGFRDFVYIMVIHIWTLDISTHEMEKLF